VSASVASAPSTLFPYRARPPQEAILREVGELVRRGGPLLVNAPNGSGKTVAALAPLVEHAVRSGHRIVYLVRTRAQELQVMRETATIGHRLDHPVVALGLEGRARRCFLLENEPELKGATAEEHGKLCADRKRATDRALRGELALTPPREFPEDGEIDLTDLDGCPYYARVAGTDVEALTERLSAKPLLPQEVDHLCREDNLCPYELTKRLLPKATVVAAPYAFFFHPRVRRSLFEWLKVSPAEIDLVIDEAHGLPGYLRDLTSVALPEESVRRARDEVEERGDFQLPEGPSATRFFDVVRAAVEELVQIVARDGDGILPPNILEEALLRSLGGTPHRLDTWLGALATWGENLRDERRRDRHLPRSWVHTVAVTLLSWPKLEPPHYAKIVTRLPRPALEAFAVDPTEAARPILSCHLSVHMSSTLAPLAEYRDSLGLGADARGIDLPSHFPAENCRYLYDPAVTTEEADLRQDPRAIARLADRIGRVLESLPGQTAVFFPDFELMRRVLDAGLQSQLPPSPFVEYARLPTTDLWRPIDGGKADPHAPVLLGVAGGRLAEGVDCPDAEIEAVVLVGVPYPSASAKRDALQEYLQGATGRGREYAVQAPAERAMRQAAGRMIRSEHDRGLVIVLDRRAERFASVLPGLSPVGDLSRLSRGFYGRRARWASLRASVPEGSASGTPSPADPTVTGLPGPDEPRL
jgi:DNA excision repair protein ERCC-2